MALIQSNSAKGLIVPPFPAFAGGIVAMRFSYDFVATPALNDILELAVIPAGSRVADMVLDCDDMDSGTALLFDVGIMSGKWQDPDNARTVGAEFFSGSNVGQAGTVARPTLKSAFRTVRTQSDRSIGVKIATAATGFVNGQIGLTVYLEG
jgi:hypothetical protein